MRIELKKRIRWSRDGLSVAPDELGRSKTLSARNFINGFAQLVVSLGLCFGPAGTFNYWQAWIYLFLTIATSAIGIAYFRRKDPKLLERRARGFKAEKSRSQKLLQVLVTVLLAASVALSSFDHRFSWSHVPLSVVVAGYALVLAGYLFIFRVFRENSFAAVNIEVETNQTVVSTGPYAVVRHPMYTGLLIVLIGTPLALGSWWGLLLVPPMVAAIAFRISYEESFLSTNLLGYISYRAKVRHRLLPLIW